MQVVGKGGVVGALAALKVVRTVAGTPVMVGEDDQSSALERQVKLLGAPEGAIEAPNEISPEALWVRTRERIEFHERLLALPRDWMSCVPRTAFSNDSSVPSCCSPEPVTLLEEELAPRAVGGTAAVGTVVSA